MLLSLFQHWYIMVFFNLSMSNLPGIGASNGSPLDAVRVNNGDYRGHFVISDNIYVCKLYSDFHLTA